MKLNELLAGCGAEPLPTGRGVDVTGITHDSRQVKAGDLFIAIPGGKVDGSLHAQEAVNRGAVAVVSEKEVDVRAPAFRVTSARKATALIAANFYGRPAESLTLLAVTGTNGKTTTSYLLEAMCAAGGAATGTIGTIRHRYAGKDIPATHTTPDPVALHKLMREMVDAAVDTVVMEVSSHALVQERVYGLTFRSAAFTNLSRDHLDYHKDLEDYFQAKRKLFTENLSAGGVAVVNGEDTYANRIYSELRNQRRMAWKFSRTGAGEISAANVEMTTAGIKAVLKTPAGDIPVKSALVGFHNLENILAAAGMALSAGYSRRDVQDGVERMKNVPGRMDRIDGKDDVVGFVDYAHSDDALRRALESARAVARGRVFVVFGCGGDRDKGKRPLMGQVAAEMADIPIITSDNPRTEDPDEIIGQITPGVEKAGLRRMSVAKAKSGEKGYLVEPDRGEAIRMAASLVKPGDVLLVAGKGHENYQQIDNERRDFDDREETRKALNA